MQVMIFTPLDLELALQVRGGPRGRVGALELHIGEEVAHPVAHRQGPELVEQEATDDERDEGRRPHDGTLEVGGVGEDPEEADEGQHEHDDAQDPAPAAVGDAQVGRVHVPVQEPLGVLVIDPVADAPDPFLHLHLHGMEAEGALAYHALRRVNLNPLLGRGHTPGGMVWITEGRLYNASDLVDSGYRAHRALSSRARGGRVPRCDGFGMRR